MTLPDFLVIGAQRAGSTWLDAWLRRHPRIYLPRRRKEVHFFDLYHDRGREWYEGFFPPDEERPRFDAIGEVTPRYLFDPEAPARIHALLPQARLVAILRDPVERCRSHHGLAVRDVAETRSLAEYLDANPEVLERGLYARQLEGFLAHFPREQIQVLISERVQADPTALARTMAHFLGTDEAGFHEAPLPPTSLNRSYRPRFPRLRALAVRASLRLRDGDHDRWIRAARAAGAGQWFGTVPVETEAMSTQLRDRLRDYYAEDRERLESLLGSVISEWGEG